MTGLLALPRRHLGMRASAVALLGSLVCLSVSAQGQAASDKLLCTAEPGTDATRRLFTRWIRDVWHEGRLDLISEIVGPEYVRHEGSTIRTVTPAQYAEEIAAVRRALPDVRFMIHECDVAGDRLWTRWSMTGTSRDSGRSVQRMAFQAYRIAGGRLVETWSLTLPDSMWP